MWSVGAAVGQAGRDRHTLDKSFMVFFDFFFIFELFNINSDRQMM